ncbi:MAG: hypothetical protein K6B74_10960 [Ruminococcus sp.]|nr:hypothetical protein [Ruminococcus sp.]
MRKLLSAAAVLIAAVMLLSSSGFRTRRRYDMRQDIGVYFTNADSVIDTIRDCLRRRSRQITICFSSHSDNMRDIDELVSELMTFARGETDRPDEGDYIAAQLGGYEARYECSLENGVYSYTIVISPDYYTDAQQESKVDERVNEIIGQLNVGRHSSEIERVRAVYRYLIENVGYDEVHKNNAHYHLKSTAYGALVNKRAVCQGYAVAAYRLFRELGLDCRVITGTASDGDLGEEYHAWNIVRVDGRYYDLDITWDKRLGTDRYFLKCESDFDSHKRDGQFTVKSFEERYPMSETSYMF